MIQITPKDSIYIGVLAAICAVCTSVLIPLPTGGMVHLGSAALFTTSALFGGLYGGLGAAIGSGLFDLIMGHSQYTLFSIVIKGFAGVLVGTLATGFLPPIHPLPKPSLWRLFVVFVLGAVWTAFGYFLAWWYVLDSATLAFTRLPSSFLTSGVGIVIAMLLVPRLERLTRRLLRQA